METPSSARLASRSLNAPPKTTKFVVQQDDDSCSDKGHRTALVDITNDSPIVGLAAGSAILKTPVSSAVKAHPRRRVPLRTPGSGEALLRCQVKALLQKVEEETEPLLVTKAGASPPEAAAAAVAGDAEAQLFKILLGHLRSPSGLLAPTPANTPVILGLPAGDNKALAASLLAQSYLANIQKSTDASSGSFMGDGTQKEEAIAILDECQINRALLFDSPGKSDTVSSNSSSCGSAVTYQGSAGSTNENCPSSAWSIQAHAGSVEEEENDDDGEEEELEEAQDDEVYEENEEEDGSEAAAGEDVLDGLCQDLSKLTVVIEDGEETLGGGGLPEFTGRHVRFVYDSDDDEMQGVVVEEGDGPSTNHSCCVARSPSVLVLKGLPTPKGKHLRFQEEED